MMFIVHNVRTVGTNFSKRYTFFLADANINIFSKIKKHFE